MSVWNAVTIEERIRQFFYVKSSLKDRRFDHLFFTTRIRNTRFLIAVLVLCFVSPPALSQSCGPHERVKELFRYSQLAERLGDQKKDHADGSACASLVPKRKPIPVPAQWWANFDASSLQEVVGNQTNGETFVESPSGDEKNNTLRVGCRGKIVDWAVEIRFYRRLDIDADYVQLQVVGKPSDNTDVNWEIPVIGPDGTVTLPGTRWSDPGLVRSNLDGEDCAFPAAKFTLYDMCKRADSLRRDDNGYLTVVGHSLGGAAAQFIASSWPSQGSDDAWPKCPGVNAYAFGSTGLELPSDDHQVVVRGTLISYISVCDEFAKVFPSRVQAGHLFTLSPTRSHLIDSIQKDLCECLIGAGNHQFNDYGAVDSPPANKSLCCPTSIWEGRGVKVDSRRCPSGT